MFSSASIAHTPAYALLEAGPSGERAAEGKCASTMFVKRFDRPFRRLFSLRLVGSTSPCHDYRSSGRVR